MRALERVTRELSSLNPRCIGECASADSGYKLRCADMVSFPEPGCGLFISCNDVSELLDSDNGFTSGRRSIIACVSSNTEPKREPSEPLVSFSGTFGAPVEFGISGDCA